MTEKTIGHLTRLWAEKRSIANTYHDKPVNSTMDLAKQDSSRALINKKGCLLIVADHQTQGRGRNDNHWLDTPGDELLCSWCFSLEKCPQHITSPLIGLALFNAAASTWPFLSFNLQAPNDLYIGNQKVGGILIENTESGRNDQLIIGIGLNVRSTPKAAQSATSLKEVLSEAPLETNDWSSFLDRLYYELKLAIENVSFQALSPRLCQCLVEALNRNPELEEPFTKIDSQGNLHTANRTIHWQDI